jgi:CHAT domain-containing protein
MAFVNLKAVNALGITQPEAPRGHGMNRRTFTAAARALAAAMGLVGILLGFAQHSFAQPRPPTQAVQDSPAVAKAREDLAKARQAPQAPLLDPLLRLGQALAADARFADAEQVFREQLAVATARFPGDTIQRGGALYNLGDAVRQGARPGDAESILLQARGVYEKLRGPESTEVAATNFLLALIYRDTGRTREAETALRGVIAMRTKLLGDTAPQLIVPLAQLGLLLRGEGRYGEMEPLFRRQIAVAKARFAADSQEVGAANNNLAAGLALAGRGAEAERLYREVIAATATPAGEHIQRANAHYNLGEMLRQANRAAEAQAPLTRARTLYEKLRGAQSAEVANAEVSLATVLVTLKKPKEAEASFKKAIAIRETVFGTTAAQLVTPLTRLGALYRDEARYGEMEPVLRRLLAIAEARFAPDSFEVGNAAFNLGFGLNAAGRYAVSEPFLRRALALYDKTRGADQIEVAFAANALGIVTLSQGRHAEAEAFHRRAIAIHEQLGGPEAPGLVSPLARLALVERELNRYEEAEAAFLRAIAIAEKAFGRDSIQLAGPLTSLANLYVQTERYALAETNAQRALKIREAGVGPDHPDTALIRFELANIANATARYAEAQDLLRRALASLERARGEDIGDVVNALISLASTYRSTGRAAEALPLVERARQIQERIGPEQPRMAYVQSWIGILARDSGKVAESEVPLQRALQLRERAFGDNHTSVASTLNDLAVTYRLLGRAREADAAQTRSLAIAEKLFGGESAAAANAYDGLAMSAIADQRFAEAETLAARAAAIRERVLGPDHVRLGWALWRLSVSQFRQGKLDEALASARQTTALYRGRAERAQNDRSESGLSEKGMVRGSFVDHVAFAHAVREKSAAGERDALLAEAFEVAQVAQATGTEAAVARMAARFASGSDELAGVVRAREDALEAWRTADEKLLRLSGRAAAERSAAEERKLRADLAALDGRIKQLDARIAREFPEYGTLSTPQPMALAEARGLLRADEAMLLWLTGSGATYAFVLRPDRASLFRIEINQRQLAEAVRALRATLDPAGVSSLADVPPFVTTRAYQLYRLMFAPAEPMLEGVRNIFIVADGPMQSLPVGVLVTDPPGPPLRDFASHQSVPWLAKRYATTVLPTASSLKSLRRFAAAAVAGAREPFFGVGNPQLNGQAGATRGINTAQMYTRGIGVNVDAVRSLPPLPETADELRAMARAMNVPDANLLLGVNATQPELVKRNLAPYRVLAFATHGLMAGEFSDVGEPALVLTPPRVARGDDDGLMTASEIARLKLNADWVILSACNTAAADGTPGAEGLSGLARAFFYAGARSLFVSHWAVLSDATVKLTTTMLAATAADPALGRAEAHRRAMIALMEDAANPHYAHPMFWAPFVVVGEGGAGN